MSDLFGRLNYWDRLRHHSWYTNERYEYIQSMANLHKQLLKLGKLVLDPTSSVLEVRAMLADIVHHHPQLEYRHRDCLVDYLADRSELTYWQRLLVANHLKDWRAEHRDLFYRTKGDLGASIDVAFGQFAQLFDVSGVVSTSKNEYRKVKARGNVEEGKNMVSQLSGQPNASILLFLTHMKRWIDFETEWPTIADDMTKVGVCSLQLLTIAGKEDNFREILQRDHASIVVALNELSFQLFFATILQEEATIANRKRLLKGFRCNLAGVYQVATFSIAKAGNHLALHYTQKYENKLKIMTEKFRKIKAADKVLEIEHNLEKLIGSLLELQQNYYYILLFKYFLSIVKVFCVVGFCYYKKYGNDLGEYIQAGRSLAYQAFNLMEPFVTEDCGEQWFELLQKTFTRLMDIFMADFEVPDERLPETARSALFRAHVEKKIPAFAEELANLVKSTFPVQMHVAYLDKLSGIETIMGNLLYGYVEVMMQRSLAVLERSERVYDVEEAEELFFKHMKNLFKIVSLSDELFDEQKWDRNGAEKFLKLIEKISKLTARMESFICIPVNDLLAIGSVGEEQRAEEEEEKKDWVKFDEPEMD